MTVNLKHAEDLEIHTCPTCFVVYAITTAMSARKHEDGTNWFCPNGHHVVFSKSMKEKYEEMRRERDRLKQDEARLEEMLADQGRTLKLTEKSRAALQGQLTKTRKRIGAGVCPCCNRQFANLQRHMAGKHAGYVAEPVQEGAAA
jgi:hypothetical protein